MTKHKGAIDAWAATYNQERPHQSLGMLTPLARFHSARPAEMHEVQPLVTTEVGVEVQRRVTTHGTITIAKHHYSVGMPYVGKIVAARIETSVVHCMVDGKVVKTLARRHTSDDVRPNTNKKHRSRRAADNRRRALDAEALTRAG